MKLLAILSLITLMSFSCKHPQDIKALNKKITLMEKEISPLESDTLFSFDNCTNKTLSGNWLQFFTGRGEHTKWEIVKDGNNQVLAQLSSDQPNYHFNGIVFNQFIAKNIELTVKMKAISGRKDQGGGFIWRCIDKDNYYVVRANPLEDNVVLYKVVDGDRSDLPVLEKGHSYGVDVKKLGNKWNTLKLRVVDDLFTVYLNGEEIFKVKDQTFSRQGKIGLWTKADAVSYFDNFQVKKL